MRRRKRSFLPRFILKVMILPRQARDERSEKLFKTGRFSQVLPKAWAAKSCHAAQPRGCTDGLHIPIDGGRFPRHYKRARGGGAMRTRNFCCIAPFSDGIRDGLPRQARDERKRISTARGVSAGHCPDWRDDDVDGGRRQCHRDGKQAQSEETNVFRGTFYT